MPSNEVKQIDPFDKEEKAVKEQLEKITKAREQQRYEKSVEDSKRNFKAKKDKLADRAADFLLKYGKDDYRTQIMITFLDVALQMEDAINLTHDMGMAMGCITEAIGCMDDILKINGLQIQSTLAVNYGFFARWKRKRELNKAVRNNAGRMKQICDTLVGNQEMAQAIVNSLRKSSVKMQNMMQKNAEKQRKIEKKANPAAAGKPSAAESMVTELARSRAGEESSGGSVNGGVTGGATAPDAPAGGSGTVDISDI